MGQYKYLFGTTRIPKLNKDEIRYGSAQPQWARHIIVTRNGHVSWRLDKMIFFKIFSKNFGCAKSAKLNDTLLGRSIRLESRKYLGKKFHIEGNPLANKKISGSLPTYFGFFLKKFPISA